MARTNMIMNTFKDKALTKDIDGWRRGLERGDISGDGMFTPNCMTFLHFAVEENHIELVKLLLEFGANPAVKCRAFTAAEAAAYYGRQDILKYILGSLTNLPPDLRKLRACSYLTKEKHIEEKMKKVGRRYFFGDAHLSNLDVLMIYLETLWSYMKTDYCWSYTRWLQAVRAVEDLLEPSNMDEFFRRFFAESCTLNYFTLLQLVNSMVQTLTIDQCLKLMEYINVASSKQNRFPSALTRIAASVIIHVGNNMNYVCITRLSDVVRKYRDRKELVLDQLLTVDSFRGNKYKLMFVAMMCRVDQYLDKHLRTVVP